MSPDSSGHRVIAVIDLRKLDLDVLTTRRFHEIQAQQAIGGDWDRVDFSRAVIIDEVARLAEHDEVYTHILTSGVDVKVLCIAVGQFDSGDPAVAIHRPYQLQPPWAATLWVSDAAGIGWRMESSQADTVYQRGSLDADQMPPAALTDSLAIPQVFDRVLEAVGGMAGAVASPGMRINHSGVDPSRLRNALQKAIHQLTRSSTGGLQQGPAIETSSLIGGSREGSSRRDPLRPGGELDELNQQCQLAADDAATAAQRLRGPSGLLMGMHGSQMRSALTRLSETAGQFAGAIEQLLDFADPQTSFETAHYEELNRHGIDIAPPTRRETAVAVDVLSDLTHTALDRHQTLPVIAEALREAADQLIPKGTRPYLERLNRLCPDRALRRLARPPAVAAVAGLPWPAALTLLVGLAAGLWSAPRALCGVLAVAACAVAAAWVTWRAAAVTGTSLASGWRFITTQIGAAVLGAACGIGLSMIVAVPARGGFLGTLLAVAFTLVLVLALAGVWWSALIRNWLQRLNMPPLLRIARSLRILLTDVSTQEWQPAAERRAASDRARIMAGIVDDVTACLQTHAASTSRPGDDMAPGGRDARTAEQRARSAERESEILAVVVIDLADAVITVLNRLFAPLSAGSLTPPGAMAVQRMLETELASYAEHLAMVGIYEAPHFGRGRSQRQQSVEALLERSVGLEDLVWSGARDANIVQLCAPDDLGLLELDPVRVEMVRFAPRSGQEFASRTLAKWAGGPPAETAQVEWTATSRISGVLRLVPLRTGAVEEVLPAGQDAAVLDAGMTINAESNRYLGAADWTLNTRGDDD